MVGINAGLVLLCSPANQSRSQSGRKNPKSSTRPILFLKVAHRWLQTRLANAVYHLTLVAVNVVALLFALGADRSAWTVSYSRNVDLVAKQAVDIFFEIRKIVIVLGAGCEDLCERLAEASPSRRLSYAFIKTFSGRFGDFAKVFLSVLAIGWEDGDSLSLVVLGEAAHV